MKFQYTFILLLGLKVDDTEWNILAILNENESRWKLSFYMSPYL